MQREWHLGHIPSRVVLMESALLLAQNFQGPTLFERIVATTGCPYRLAQKKVMRHGLVTTGWGVDTIWQYAWPSIDGWRELGAWLRSERMLDDLGMCDEEFSLAFGTTRDRSAVEGDLRGVYDRRNHLIRRVKARGI